MKTYGVPDVETPDHVDYLTYALKSSKYGKKKKCGVHVGVHDTKNKRRTRIMLKKAYRTQLKRELDNLF
jgi:hypothetical protein